MFEELDLKIDAANGSGEKTMATVTQVVNGGACLPETVVFSCIKGVCK